MAEASRSTTIPPLTIATRVLPSGIEGTQYGALLEATGGTPEYTWKLSSGSLPAGISLASSSGIISGSPTVAGNFSFAVTVGDSSDPVQTKSTAMTITVAPPPLTIAAPAFPAGTFNTPYSQTLHASGGTPDYTWAITSGTLPVGLRLAASTGVIAGTPAGSGTWNFTATAHDSEKPSQAASVEMSIPRAR